MLLIDTTGIKKRLSINKKEHNISNILLRNEDKWLLQLLFAWTQVPKSVDKKGKRWDANHTYNLMNTHISSWGFYTS